MRLEDAAGIAVGQHQAVAVADHRMHDVALHLQRRQEFGGRLGVVEGDGRAAVERSEVQQGGELTLSLFAVAHRLGHGAGQVGQQQGHPGGQHHQLAQAVAQ